MNICRETKDYYYTGNPDKPENWLRISKTLVKSLDNPVILAAPDKTWRHPNHMTGSVILLSDGNSKVNAFAKSIGTKAVAFGKSTILSCPFASSCIRFCYQNLNNYTGSARLHGHNYYTVYSRDRDAIRKAIKAGLKLLAKSVTVVRLNDNGDFISLAEILAWLDTAIDNPNMVFYGYTKNTPHLYKARQKFGQFPSNFRVSISDTNENDPTSERYADKLRNEYSNEFRTCRIIDTPERDELYAELPWNDEETAAYNYTSDFKIALHISTSQFQFCSPDEIAIEMKYSTGIENGVKVC